MITMKVGKENVIETNYGKLTIDTDDNNQVILINILTDCIPTIEVTGNKIRIRIQKTTSTFPCTCKSSGKINCPIHGEK